MNAEVEVFPLKASVCDRCKAVVVDEATHRDWHVRFLGDIPPSDAEKRRRRAS